MPILDPHALEIISRSAEQTRRVGVRLGAVLRPGYVICLVGDLGSGKTTLVQGIGAGWGSLDEVSSPSFVLVNVYRRPDGQRLYHLDAYRLSGAREAEDLDMDALIESGPLVVEWADRIQEVLPASHLRIQLRHMDISQRDLLFTASGEPYRGLINTMRKQAFGVRA